MQARQTREGKKEVTRGRLRSEQQDQIILPAITFVTPNGDMSANLGTEVSAHLRIRVLEFFNVNFLEEAFFSVLNVVLFQY